MPPEDDALPVVEDDTGFEDGFASPDTPTETPGTEQSNTANEQMVEFVQLTKTEHEALTAAAAAVPELRAALDKGLGTAFGKMGGYERDMQALKSGKRVEIDQADIDALKEDFAPIATALQKVRDMQVIHAGGAIDDAAIDAMVEQRMQPAIEKVRTETAKAFEMRLLSMVHRDWPTVTKSDEFLAYIEKQPADVQEKLANSWDATYLGDFLTEFKQATKPQSQASDEPDPDSTRRGRMHAAATPRGSGRPAAADSEDDLEAGFKQG